MIPPEQWETGQQLAGFLGGEGAACAGSQDQVGVGAALGGGDLADRVGVDGAFVEGELEDPQGQGAALAKGGRADLGGQVTLPAADVGGADALDRAVAEPGSHVQSESALGDGQGVGAAVRIGGVQLPPLIGPAAERQPTAAAALPGAASEFQAFLGGQVAGLVGRVHGLGALGAVVESPGDLVAVAALAPGHRAHSGLRSPSVSNQGLAGDGMPCRGT